MTLSINTQKGGTGKTTIMTHVAVGLSRKGFKTLAIDLDPQASASDILFPEFETFESVGELSDTVYSTIIDKKPLPIFQSKYENLEIVPSHIDLSTADIQLAIDPGRSDSRLKKQLDKVKDNYDYVVIDCPPNLGMLNVNALVASTHYMVVVCPSRGAIRAITHLNNTINSLIRNEFEHDISLVGYLFNMNLKRRNIDKITRKDLIKEVGEENVMNTYIKRLTAIERAMYECSTVWDYDRTSIACDLFTNLVDEIITHEQTN